MFGCSCEAKYGAYRAVVRPILEYAAVVWCPHAKGDINLLESIQGRAARWICGSRWKPTDSSSWTISSSNCCTKLNLSSLQVRRHYLSICFLHDIHHKHTSLSFDQFCDLNSMPSRSHHLSLILPTSTINSRRFSFLSTQHSYGTQFQFIFLKIEIPNLSGIPYIIICVIIKSCSYIVNVLP